MSVPVQSGPAQMGMQVTPDRRCHERLRTRTPMHIVRLGEEMVACDAVCTDVSVGGLGFDTTAAIKVGTVMEFEFVNADHSGMTFEARVLYRSGQHYGAYFLHAV